MEKVCSSCCEEQARVVARPVNWFAVLIVFGGAVAATLIVARMPRVSVAIFSVGEYLDSAGPSRKSPRFQAMRQLRLFDPVQDVQRNC